MKIKNEIEMLPNWNESVLKQILNKNKSKVIEIKTLIQLT